MTQSNLLRRLWLLCLLCLPFGMARAVGLDNFGAVYQIVSAESGQALTNGDDGENDVYLSAADPSAAALGQQWMLLPVDAGNGIYALFNPNYGKCLDMASTATDAWHLLQWECETTNENQQFLIQAVDGEADVYRLFSATDGSRVLTLRADGSFHMDTDAAADGTRFRLTDTGQTATITQPYSGLTYVFTNRANGQVISNRGSRAAETLIYTEERDDSQFSQRWQIRPAQVGNSTRTVLFNETYNFAIDANLNGYMQPLQYTLGASNANQQVTVKAVDGEEGVYQLTYNYNGATYYLRADEYGITYMVQNGGDETTYFTLEAVAPPVVVRNDWENERVFAVGKEAAHAAYMPYATTAEMRADADRYARPWLSPESSRYLSLNGVWKLNWVNDPEKRPGESFYADEADVSGWDDVTVPGCLEMQGYGDPWYINVNYAFNDNPPYLEMLGQLYNSVGSYRRDFTLPEAWAGQRVVLHFDGIYSGAYVWVNGQKVGYTQGSNNDAEFDVTDYVRSGSNNVSVQVFRFTDGSYLEGQDMWHMSGIHRDVYLYATPQTYVRDHYLSADLDAASDYRAGTLSVDLTLTRRDTERADKQVRVRLLSPEGSEIATETVLFNFGAEDSPSEMEAAATFAGLSGLQLWTAETPTLYTVEVALLDAATGEEEEAFSTKYGFRHIEIPSGDHRVYINGKQVYFKGVNTQDTHPLTGRTIDVETMLEDIRLMKLANVNTVRASHYPRQSKMYAMFDYYGLYVMDEADVECHKNWQDNATADVLSNNTNWQPQYLDRTERMVLRDRNFPSVIFWSLGNESGIGENFRATYNRCKELDSRLVHYEGATYGGASYGTDLWSKMYPSLDETSSAANGNWRRQPYFMCEYAHAMGNSVGNLQEYWDILENSTYGIGGCIWDWVDQSIVSAADIKAGNLTQNGFNKYRTGYDWDAAPHQGNFVNNGIIGADRAWSAKLSEVKKVYQYVKFTGFSSSAKRLTLRNAYDFIDLDRFVLRYAILENGVQVESGTTELPAVQPAATTTLTLPYAYDINAPAAEGKEIALNLEVCLKEATDYAEADYAVAAAQYVLKNRPAALAAVSVAGLAPLTMEQSASRTTIANDSISISFAADGSIRDWTARGVKVVNTNGGPEYENYRWIENDAPYNVDPTYDYANGVTAKSATFSLADDGQTATVTVRAQGSLSNYVFVYTVYANGTVDFRADYTPQSDDLRRLGMQVFFPGSYDNVTYYARGPQENYVDRKTGAFLGRYTSTVRDMAEYYLRPQTMGNREDLRELILTDDEGTGVRVETAGQVAFSTLYWTDRRLKQTSHNWELPLSSSVSGRTIYAHFDYMQKGLGVGSCGPGTIDKYLVPSTGTYGYTLRFSPVTAGTAQGIGQTTSLEGLRVSHSGSEVSVSGKIEAGTAIAVYNLGGVCIGRTSAAAPAQQLTLRIADAPRGSYLLRIESPSGSRTHKFVK